VAWFYLFLAGVFELGWAVGIKYCEGIKLSFPLFVVVFSMIASIVFLWLAVKVIPMGVAYAAWSGIGIIGVFAYGVLILREPFSISNLIFIALILAGIIGLKLGTKY
jgi:quaternary ammonium compound-resistance protein SugE